MHSLPPLEKKFLSVAIIGCKELRRCLARAVGSYIEGEFVSCLHSRIFRIYKSWELISLFLANRNCQIIRKRNCQ